MIRCALSLQPGDMTLPDYSTRNADDSAVTPHASGSTRTAFGMLVISLGAMLGPLDSAVNVAFPLITQSFALRISDIQWIVIVYILAQSSFSIVFGKMGDMYGHRRIFMAGCAVCALVHVLAGFAPDYKTLIALRGLQGLAIGVAMSCGPALATFLFPPQEKRRALAIYTMLFGLGLAIGPVLGGVMIEAWGWPAVFWYRAPLALFALAFAFVLPAREMTGTPRASFDLLGALLLIITLASFVGTLALIRHALTMPHWLALMAILCTLSAFLFVRHELRAPDPVVHVAFYRDKSFAGIQFATIAINFFAFGFFLFAPYMFAARPDTPLVTAGLMLALYPCGQIAAGFLASRLSGSVRSATLVKAGMIISALGLIGTGFASAAPSLWLLGATLILAGAGLGTFQVGNLDLTTSILPVHTRGVAGSLVNVARLLGIVIGAALITLLYDAIRATWPASEPLQTFRAVYGALGICLLALALTLSGTIFRRL